VLNNELVIVCSQTRYGGMEEKYRSKRKVSEPDSDGEVLVLEDLGLPKSKKTRKMSQTQPSTSGTSGSRPAKGQVGAKGKSKGPEKVIIVEDESLSSESGESKHETEKSTGKSMFTIVKFVFLLFFVVKLHLVLLNLYKLFVRV
jgi:hypothetical protein